MNKELAETVVFTMLKGVGQAYKEKTMSQLVTAKDVTFEAMETALKQFSRDYNYSMMIRSIYLVNIGGNDFRYGDATSEVTDITDIRRYVSLGFELSTDSDKHTFALSVVWLPQDPWPSIFIWDASGKRYIVVEFCTAQQLSDLRREGSGAHYADLMPDGSMDIIAVFESDTSRKIDLSKTMEHILKSFVTDTCNYLNACASVIITDKNGVTVSMNTFLDMLYNKNDQKGAIKIASARRPLRLKWERNTVICVERQIQLTIKYVGERNEVSAEMTRNRQEVTVEAGVPINDIKIVSDEKRFPVNGDFVDFTYKPQEAEARELASIRESEVTFETNSYVIFVKAVAALRETHTASRFDNIMFTAALKIAEGLVQEGRFEHARFGRHIVKEGLTGLIIADKDHKEYELNFA